MRRERQQPRESSPLAAFASADDFRNSHAWHFAILELVNRAFLLLQLPQRHVLTPDDAPRP